MMRRPRSGDPAAAGARARCWSSRARWGRLPDRRPVARGPSSWTQSSTSSRRTQTPSRAAPHRGRHEQAYAEVASSVVNARVVIFHVLDDTAAAHHLRRLEHASSVDIERDPLVRAAATGMTQRGTVERGKRRFARSPYRFARQTRSYLLSDSLVDPLSSLPSRRTAAADRRPDRALSSPPSSARGGRLCTRAASAGSSGPSSGSPPVASTNRSSRRAGDELGELAAAVERMRRRLGEPGSSQARVHRERLARAAHAAVLAWWLPRVDGGRRPGRGDPPGIPGDDA